MNNARKMSASELFKTKNSTVYGTKPMKISKENLPGSNKTIKKLKNKG